MKTPISVIIEDENLVNLEKKAATENRSRSNMLNRILEEFFSSDDKDEEF